MKLPSGGWEPAHSGQAPLDLSGVNPPHWFLTSRRRSSAFSARRASRSWLLTGGILLASSQSLGAIQIRPNVRESETFGVKTQQMLEFVRPVYGLLPYRRGRGAPRSQSRESAPAGR